MLQHIIFKIDLITQPLVGKLHMNIGGVKSLFFIISKCLDALLTPMHMSLMIHEENLSRNPIDVYFLDMAKILESRVINYIT